MAALTETDKYGRFVRRIMRAYGRRVADLDIEGLKGLVDLRTELDDQIKHLRPAPPGPGLLVGRDRPRPRHLQAGRPAALRALISPRALTERSSR